MNETVQLNNGNEMPAIGFGTWQIAPGATAAAVGHALQAGYRLVDTAKLYANEQGVGEATRNSGIDREQIFVSTKLWNDDHGSDKTIPAFEASLSRLGLDYVDLYLIHWPGDDQNKRHESWQALTEIYQDGRAKNIGVSNFDTDHLEALLGTTKVLPVVNQIEFHPWVYNRQAATVAFCKRYGITVQAYSPLAKGGLIDNEVIKKLAASKHKTTSQIILRWCIQHGTVPLPRSENPKHIEENLDVFNFELDESDIEAINNISFG